MMATAAASMAAPHGPDVIGTAAEKAQPLDWVVVTLDEVPAALQQQSASGASDGVEIRGWHNRSTRFWRRKPSSSTGGSTASDGSARDKQQHAATTAVEQPAGVGDPKDGDAHDAQRSRPRRRAAREGGQQQQRRCRSSGTGARLAQP